MMGNLETLAIQPNVYYTVEETAQLRIDVEAGWKGA